MPTARFDFSVLGALHDAYQQCKTHDNWGAMYVELATATKSVTQTLCARHKLRLSEDRIDDVVSDVALRIARRFLTREYAVKNWYSLIYLDVKSVMFDRKTQRLDAQPPVRGVQPVLTTFRDETGYMSDIIADRDIDGRRIVKDLFLTRLKKTRRTSQQSHHEREYKTAINTIAVYTPREHIYRYAVELRAIFDTLRIRGGADHGSSKIKKQNN
jgi:hypothetical protein